MTSAHCYSGYQNAMMRELLNYSSWLIFGALYLLFWLNRRAPRTQKERASQDRRKLLLARLSWLPITVSLFFWAPLSRESISAILAHPMGRVLSTGLLFAVPLGGLCCGIGALRKLERSDSGLLLAEAAVGTALNALALLVLIVVSVASL